MEYFAFGCRCLLGLMFVVSAAGKIGSRAAFQEFRTTVELMLGGRRGAAGPAAAAVVACEATVSVLLASPATARAGLALAAVLLATFCVAIAIALRRGVNAPCRCFGGSSPSQPLRARHIARNLALTVLAIGAIFADPAGPDTAGMVVAAAAGAVGAFLAIRYDDFADLFLAPARTASTSRTEGKRHAVPDRRTDSPGSALHVRTGSGARRDSPAA
ncbi:MauE/DoxX family redox-associated membrane protein [Nonomuraea sp. NPDC046802]|uniref:MauE/DoxX family redox-associated membrane protein n=1 Tax=Nonomuraea sp. NPDC046802 TaxID=3154919 RepID=UPI0033D77B40